jgi:predicted amidohydrolase YtcJ
MKRISLVIVLLLAGCVPPDGNNPTQQSPTQPSVQIVTPAPTIPAESAAEVIFYNGAILTMNPGQPHPQAIAIRGEKILAIGTDQEITALKDDHTRMIDLGGLTLMPGFVDAHTHLLNDAGTFGTDLDGVQQLALENGITTIGNMFTSPEFLTEMQDYNEGNHLRVRVSLYLIYNTNCGDVIGDWWKDVPPTRAPGEMLRTGGLKIFADGGSCNRPALSYETSPGSGLGDLYLTGDQIADVVREAQDLGHQVAIHALGDRAIEAALDGIGSALDGGPNTYRHRIEHNAILRPDLLPRYGEIGVVATIFATFPSCTPFGNPSPAPYNQWEWAWPTLIEANPDLHIAWHGDDPYIAPLNPILELYGFVTRKQVQQDRSEVCDPPDWIRDDTLTVDQALPMMTRESAYALFRDEEVGSLETGKYADLIILSHDPMSENTDTLLDTYVLMTMVGGQVEFCAPGNEALCPTTPTPTTDSDTIPFGYVDGPAPGESISGTFNVYGWALDDTPIERVEIYLDDQYIGDAVYGDPRPDVANDYPGREGAPNFGYSFQLDTTLYENDPHILSALAFDSSGDQGYLYPESVSITIDN